LKGIQSSASQDTSISHVLQTSKVQGESWEPEEFQSAIILKIVRLPWLILKVTAFKRDCHLCLPRAESIQSMPSQPTYLTSVLILSSHLLAVLTSCLFP